MGNRFGFFVALAICGMLSLSAQITVTAPAANETIKAADDYATQMFQDSWDMNQWTDLGWFTFGVDQPTSNLTNIGFSGGIFSATGTSAVPPNFWLLDPYVPGQMPLGKIGSLYPINTTKYRHFLTRMSLTGAGMVNPPTSSNQAAQFIWNLYPSPASQASPSTSNAFFTYPGYWIYSVDLPTLGVGSTPSWLSGPATSLRLAPVNLPNISINVDWARLVADDGTSSRTITWTGSGGVDIFLDNDKNFSNGLLAQIATNVSGNSFTFFAGGLAPGTYYVAIRPFGSSATPAYSAGAWTISDIPTLTFTAPNPEGSADDFATVQLGNAWDMDSLGDVDLTNNLSGVTITNINARDEAGNALPNTRVLFGNTAMDFGDPEVYLLWWAKRGATTMIDTSRYRILSVKWGNPLARDINNGSVGRVIWRVHGDAMENVSTEIVLDTLPGVNVIQDTIVDMKTMQLEASSPSHTGWTGMADGFRLDSAEFSTPMQVYIESAKLSSFEKADASYLIQWNYANAGPTAPSLSFFYDTTGTGFNGTQIVSGLNPTTGSYTWNTSALANGTYYIYSRILNGATVMNQSYARWPLVVQHGGLSTLTLDRSKVNFGATGATVTSPQVVRVNTAPGVTWTVSSNQTYATVSPTSGTGSGTFTITVQSGSLPSPSTQTATVSVSSNGVSNSPQNVQVNVNVMNAGSVGVPFGSFDTPANNTNGIAGAIAVGGWALDNIEVTSVDIWRDPVGGEPAGLVFIGTATFVEGARPDVAGTYPGAPRFTRAGWGYSLLTNFLPNPSGGAVGNGTYKLHAIAHSRTGQSTDLGSSTITVDNADANKPFGTIDTPNQGGSVSGTLTNFGWALTQNPNCIPMDGSTITVAVDGVTLGHPTYNQFRSDIATTFPGRCNSQGAVGYFNINTATLANGVHTIYWLVYDNVGHGDGIGSRFFTVTGGSSSAAPEQTSNVTSIGPVTLRSGFDLGTEAKTLTSGPGGAYSVEMDELGRIELQLSASRGFEIVNGERHQLPIGSTLQDGSFVWHAGPGFLGRYRLEFERPDGSTVGVWVTVRPKRFGSSSR